MVRRSQFRTPTSLRGALDQIQRMLTNKAYSEDLWNILAALRGPDSRDRKIKYATTAVIRSSAFPKHPCSALSVFGDDKDHLVSRRKQLFRTRKDANHFREHVAVAFEALGLKLYARNKLSEELWDTNRFSKK